MKRNNRIIRQANFNVIEIPHTVTGKDVTSGNFLKKKENLFLFGPVGIKKTHLATAVRVEA